MHRDLLKLCEFDVRTRFSLLYRGSRDGFGGRDFHSKCDNEPKTLAIVKSTSECIFGGYTEAMWSKDNVYKTDPNAFLFSLINNENEPIKIKVAQESADMAIYCGNGDGPIFGGPILFRDLYISSDSNINKSYSELGNCFKHPKYPRESEAAINFLAGTYNFKVAEIEVFQID